MIYKKKIEKNIIETLYRLNVNGVVLSQNLHENVGLRKMLYQENLNILDGRYLFEVMLIDCVEYIAIKQHKLVSDLEITILVNDVSTKIFSLVWLLASKAKNLCIVTNYIDKFKIIQEKIRDKLGFIVRISNNKRKSLSNAKIIINIDFAEENINKYNINERAILINTNKKIKIESKRFCGINIWNYKIQVPRKILESYNHIFNVNEIYESMIYNEPNLYVAREKIKADNIKIMALIGNKGEICDKEYLNFI